MNASTNFKANRTTDSTDRNATLVTGSRSTGAANPKSVSVRIDGTARRLLNALMRSLATPHI